MQHKESCRRESHFFTITPSSSSNNKIKKAVCLFVLVITSLCIVTETYAYPFERNSNVTELTPITFQAFINTHKPVMILFYAPWCGHCKHFKSEYVKFAKNVKGVIRVGAINADEYKEFAHQYGIKGFPTVKYWRMGRTNLKSTATTLSQEANEYHGPRTAAALQTLMVDELVYDKVLRANSKSTLKQIVESAPHNKAVVLFSGKDKIPALWSVLSYSPKLQEVAFVFAGNGNDNELAKQLHITSFPSIFVVVNTTTTSATSSSSSDNPFRLVPYKDSTNSYDSIGRFILKCVEGQCE